VFGLQDEIIHEAQTMKSYNHPNVLSLYTSFVHGQDLWMVTPFMSGGSILHIMKYRFPKVCCALTAHDTIITTISCLQLFVLQLWLLCNKRCCMPAHSCTHRSMHSQQHATTVAPVMLCSTCMQHTPVP